MVVQGFPRSGNTYLSIAISEYRNFEGSIFSHIHTPAIFFHAFRKNIPVVMPIRDPLSSIVSLIQLTGWDDLRCIDHYKCYYRLSRPYAERLIILNFKDFTKNTPDAFKRISQHSGMEFRDVPHEQIQAYCFEEIDRRSLAQSGEMVSNWIHRPDETRSSKKDEVRARLERLHGDALAECNEAYRYFLKKSL